jgi:hypothetical protein
MTPSVGMAMPDMSGWLAENVDPPEHVDVVTVVFVESGLQTSIVSPPDP